MLAFWHCTSPQLMCLWTCGGHEAAAGWRGWMDTAANRDLRLADRRGVGSVGAAAEWSSKILPCSHLSQLLLCQRTASPERTLLHTPTATEQNIPAGHLTERAVLLTRTHCCTLSSASIGKTTANYISFLLSDGILHLSLLPALEYLCWFGGNKSVSSMKLQIQLLWLA